MPLQALLFDLDGTLVDTVEGIEWAFRRALAAVVPNQVVPDLRPFIGPPARDVLVTALPRLPEAQVAAVLMEFRRIYNTEGWRRSRLYPGVTDVLTKIRQRGMMSLLVTNKPAIPAHNIVAGLGIEPFLHDIVCPDSREPAFADKTAMVSFMLAKHGLNPTATLLVGDTDHDALAAGALDIPFAHAAYGYGQLSEAAAKTVALTLSELPDILEFVSQAA
jgi:phosphoglycolate phosphatase